MRFLRWFLPGGLVLVLALALVLGVEPGLLGQRLNPSFPWFVWGASFLLAGYFHRSRVVAILLSLFLLSILSPQSAAGFTGFTLGLFIFGLTAGVLTLMNDRGVLTVPGMIQAGGVVVLGGFGVLLVSVAPQDLSAFLSARPLSPHWTVWSGLQQPVFFSLSFALVVSGAASLTRDGPVERGVFWSILMVVLANYFSGSPGAMTLFLLGAGLTLGLSVIETSYAMAYRDDLTGLPARRALLRDLENLGGTYAAAMVDVDHFKRFNDKYGHDVGDQVLRMVASRLSRTTGGGRAYRFGGEEFTILFPGKTVSDVLPHLRTTRQAVEDAAFVLRSWRRPKKKPVDPGAWKAGRDMEPKRLSVTVSIGVADSKDNRSSPESVLKKADEALYRAKRAGRNQVKK